MSPSNFHVVEHKLPCQHIREYPAATTHTQEDVLYLVLKQYIPINNPNPQPGDVTIIASTANGLPKEVYEPLWEDLYTCCEAQGIRTRGIWIADMAHQGKSGLINGDSAGNDPSVFDHSRDLLHFINSKREDMPRPVVGIGHSLGATSLVHLSLFHPRLFHTLVLLDPIIIRPVTTLANGEAYNHKDFLETYVAPCTFRRDVWPSREVAVKSFRRSPFFQSWDPRVLELWIQYGVRSISDPSPDLEKRQKDSDKDPVTLTTTVTHEVTMCGRPYYTRRFPEKSPTHPDNHITHPDIDPMLLTSFPFYRPESAAMFYQLPHLRPSVLYMFGGKSRIALPELRADKIRNTGTGVGGSGGESVGRVKEAYFEDLGHLIGLEGTTECADAMTRWLGPELRRWKEEEQFFHDTWYSKSTQEKAVVDSQWSKHVPRMERKPKATGGGDVGETSKL